MKTRNSTYIATSLALIFLLSSLSARAMKVTIDGNLVIKPGDGNNLEMTVIPNSDGSIQSSYSRTFATFLGSGSTTILPTQQNNQFILVFPQPRSLNGQQIAGVSISAYTYDGSNASQSISFNTLATINLMTQHTDVPEDAGNNHGLPPFSPINALSQGAVIQAITQTLFHPQPAVPEQIPIPEHLNMGGEAHINNQITNITDNAEGNLEITTSLSTNNPHRFSIINMNGATVVVTVRVLSAEEISPYRRNQVPLHFFSWMKKMARYYCDANAHRYYRDKATEFWQGFWGQEQDGKQSMGTQNSETYEAIALKAGVMNIMRSHQEGAAFENLVIK